LVGESTPPSPKQVEAPRPQEQEGAPKPPRSGIEGDPSTISDGSDGDRLSKDARSTDEKVEASPVVEQTPWPIGLHSVGRRGRRKRKSASGRRSNVCRRGSNSRSRKEKKKKKGGGNKGTSSRSCWSRIGSRSCGSSRGNNGRRVSS